MTDVFSKKKRSEVMSKIRGKDTKPELCVRTALHQLGYRYRLHDHSLPGRPDIVLKKYNAVIQIRGCFWHSHDCIDGHIPKSHIDYWEKKLEQTKKRDRRNDLKLRALGWHVIVVWECSCSTPKGLEKQIMRITRLLNNWNYYSNF